MRDATVRTASGKFGQTVEVGPHRLPADEPVESGGDDTGPAPHELLEAALGACTSMTVKMYADRKGWPLRAAAVRVRLEKQGDATTLHRSVTLEGDLDDEQRARLLEIANKCP